MRNILWVPVTLEIIKTTAEIDIFDARHEECNIIERFASFCQHFVLLSPKKGEKHAFLLKNGPTTCHL